ncbi:MAG: OmpH family outer membrane protein [Candidatus Omnitrophica bacterium]|nr:OmpH family outer membrane protein [Candidatus Omnitrophota bacterium]
MKSLKVFSLILAFLIVGAYPVLAQQALKIAYVDVGRLFDEYEKTKSYDKVLEADSKKFEEERNKKIDQIKELQGKLAMLKEAEKTKSEKDMEKMKNEIIEFDRTKRTDLTKARDEKVREILLEIEKVVAEYAKAQGITFVLNDRTLIYGQADLNITAPILKTLNENYSKLQQPKK